jgi:hypothetical protein
MAPAHVTATWGKCREPSGITSGVCDAAAIAVRYPASLPLKHAYEVNQSRSPWIATANKAIVSVFSHTARSGEVLSELTARNLSARCQVTHLGSGTSELPPKLSTDSAPPPPPGGGVEPFRTHTWLHCLFSAAKGSRSAVHRRPQRAPIC